MTITSSAALPWRKLVQMTRSGFLVITAIACALGAAEATAYEHRLIVQTALATLVFAWLMLADLQMCLFITNKL
jgi:hypothetical protein